MKKSLLHRKKLFSISFFLVLIDQITKHLLLIMLWNKDSIILIPKLIKINLVKNTGAAFSLFTDSTFNLGLLSFVVTIILCYLIWKSVALETWKGLSISLLLAGTLGNGLDRWFLGYVIDFIELIPIAFPIFNIADILINLALICLFIDTINSKERQNNV